MVHAVESIAVVEDEFDVRHELEHAIIARLGRGRLKLDLLGRVRRRQLPVDGGEVHRTRDNRVIVGDVERDGINGEEEGIGVFLLLETTHYALGKLELLSGQGRVGLWRVTFDGGWNRCHCW